MSTPVVPDCVICGVNGGNHNAEPLANGKCCNDCNGQVVLYRLYLETFPPPSNSSETTSTVSDDSSETSSTASDDSSKASDVSCKASSTASDDSSEASCGVSLIKKKSLIVIITR